MKAISITVLTLFTLALFLAGCGGQYGVTGVGTVSNPTPETVVDDNGIIDSGTTPDQNFPDGAPNDGSSSAGESVLTGKATVGYHGCDYYEIEFIDDDTANIAFYSDEAMANLCIEQDSQCESDDEGTTYCSNSEFQVGIPHDRSEGVMILEQEAPQSVPPGSSDSAPIQAGERLIVGHHSICDDVSELSQHCIAERSAEREHAASGKKIITKNGSGFGQASDVSDKLSNPIMLFTHDTSYGHIQEDIQDDMAQISQSIQRVEKTDDEPSLAPERPVR